MRNSSSTHTSLKRDSNMELARIVAMAMILIGHFIFHGLQNGMPSPDELPVMGVAEITLMSIWALCMPGVDLLMLISGYFGIKLNWKRVISFWFLCVFYNAVNLLVNVPLSEICFTQAVDVFFISKTGNWFFQAYLWTMMASPILNKALAEFDIKAIRVISAIGVVLLCISSWKFSNPKVHSALLLFVLYFLGGYLRKEPFVQNITRRTALGCYCISAFAIILSGILVYNVFHKQYGIFLQDNCIFIVLMAISLFLFFKTFSFHSKIINVWASTVVAAIFIQDVILYVPLYNFFHSLYLHEGFGIKILLDVLLGTFSVFLVAFLIEWPRKKVADWLANSVSNRLNNVIDLGKTLGNQ